MKNEASAAGPHWAAPCGVLSRARSAATSAPCVLARAQRTPGRRSVISHQLQKDHEEVKGLFQQLTKKGNGKADKVFGKLRDELLAHSKAEEKVFYKPLQGQDETRRTVLEGIEEHHIATLVLKELDKNQDGERWQAKLKVLQEMVEHHIEEEEGSVFTSARELLDAGQLEKLGSQFEEEEKKILEK